MMTQAQRGAAVPASPEERDDADFLAAMGRRVRDARERRGMARKVLSQSAGVSERYLAQLEAGEGNASVLLLRNVARALGLPLTELIDGAAIRSSSASSAGSSSACRNTGSRTSCSG